MTHSLFDGYWGRATTELANLGQKAELQSPRVHWVGQLQSSAMSTLPADSRNFTQSSRLHSYTVGELLNHILSSSEPVS